MTQTSLLNLTVVSPTRFSTDVTHTNFGGAVYGGQFLAQAARAAAFTVSPALVCHSQHAQFIGPGRPDRPLEYEVTSLRDGQSVLRRVAAFQDDRLVFEASCSFAAVTEGMSHGPAMPAAPSPEDCFELAAYVTDHSPELHPEIVERFRRTYPLERRLVDPDSVFLNRSTNTQMMWLRVRDADPYATDADQRCMIAYMSDAWLSAAAFRRHFAIREASTIRSMSLDHAVWIHASAPIGNWLLYVADGPWAGNRRGFGRGQLFDRSGLLIASTAQEGLTLGRP